MRLVRCTTFIEVRREHRHKISSREPDERKGDAFIAGIKMVEVVPRVRQSS